MSPVVKRKREKFSIPSKYLLIIIIVLCGILLGVERFTDRG